MDLDDFKRFGGDEFAVLFEDLEKVDHAINVAQRVERGLIAPFEMVGHEVVVTISIGIVSAARGETGEDYAEELMRRSDIATSRSKNEGKNRHEVFSPGMNHSPRRSKSEENLRTAIERGEFRVRTGPRCGRAPAQWSAWRPW